jgi:hypothetical protein
MDTALKARFARLPKDVLASLLQCCGPVSPTERSICGASPRRAHPPGPQPGIKRLWPCG